MIKNKSQQIKKQKWQKRKVDATKTKLKNHEKKIEKWQKKLDIGFFILIVVGRMKNLIYRLFFASLENQALAAQVRELDNLLDGLKADNLKSEKLLIAFRQTKKTNH